MSGGLAPFVRAMGRGPSRGRNLDRAEAAEAMRLILAGEAAPEAVGALFMLMRYRGETSAEIAGMVDAMRARIAPWREIGAALDWPSYAAGRTRGAPFFLLAAKLIARAEHSVTVHGWNSHLSHPASTIAGVEAMKIAVAEDAASARAALAADGLVYIRLEAIDAELMRLLRLRDVLGLRSPINTALRAFNPCGAAASAQGVFHPVFRGLQTEAARLLEQPAVAVIKGGGGEFERHPGKAIELYGYTADAPFDFAMAPLSAFEARRMKSDEEAPDAAHLPALWSGARRNEFEEALVIATAGAALLTLGAAPTLAEAEEMARALWRDRLD
ncbi:MAG: glycosyl transferase family protein [Pseudomonadota bacterium]